ncbi:hypothetical protein Tco_0656148 [Tanacetum coccineum]|uniref:Uncharacterized protein n=1 Tax=Tanacetum coccineum TaxID=301880 RepID=A0ABQ4X810_9ASTR
MDKEFTATAYPNIQENLKLTVDDPVIPEEPASSTGTLYSLQHLAKDFSFGDQFFNDKPLEANNEKTTTDTEAESMVSVTIHQDTSAIPPMTSPVLDLIDSTDSPLVLENQDIPNQVSRAVDEIVTDAVDWAMHAPLRERFRDLPEGLEKSVARDNRDQLLSDLAEARKKKKKRQGSHKTPLGSPPHPPPPPPPPAGPSGTLGTSGASGSSTPPPPPPLSNTQGGQSTSTAAPSSSKMAASAEYTAWTMTDTRHSRGLTILQMLVEAITVGRPAHLKPACLSSSDLNAQRKTGPCSGKSSITLYRELRTLLRSFQMEECHKLLTGFTWSMQSKYNVSKNTTVWVVIRACKLQDFFFNKDLEYLRYSRKIGRPALSISKMKAVYYSDVGLEQMVPDQIWIEEECKYDVAAMLYIITWWFQRQRFYIDRHTSEGDRRAVRTHMRILSVVRIEVFPMYGYNYMKKIVLRRVDLKEYVISKRDFKYLYPSDFKDLYLLNLQGHLNHLSPEDKKILTTAVNLWPETGYLTNTYETFSWDWRYQSQ